MYFALLWKSARWAKGKRTRSDIIIHRLPRIHPNIFISRGAFIVRPGSRVEPQNRIENVLALRRELDRSRRVGLIVFIEWSIGRFRRSVLVRRLLLLLTLADFVGLRHGRVEGLLGRLTESGAGQHLYYVLLGILYDFVFSPLEIALVAVAILVFSLVELLMLNLCRHDFHVAINKTSGVGKSRVSNAEHVKKSRRSPDDSKHVENRRKAAIPSERGD